MQVLFWINEIHRNKYKISFSDINEVSIELSYYSITSFLSSTPGIHSDKLEVFKEDM